MASGIKVIVGAGSIGTVSLEGLATIGEPKAVNAILHEFKKHGHNQIDTSRVYGAGTSESVLAEVDFAGQGFIVDTKINPWVPNSLKPENIQKSVEESLAALKQKKVHILYFHVPDRTTPLEESLAAIDAEYKKGHFEKFGISNYTAQEVEEIVRITTEKGYVKPSVYQGQYNLVARANEKELFPLLRKHNIAFYAYSPLAGSFLTGDLTKKGSTVDGNSTRFDAEGKVGEIYRAYYFKDNYFQAVDKLKAVAEKHGITVQEIALRWIAHHSQLNKKYGDGIITGGTKLVNIQKSLRALDQPALPADIVKVTEEIWESVKDNAPPYHL